MDEETINILMKLNIDYYTKVKEALYQNFLEVDNFIKEQKKKIAQHHHFKKKKDMENAMRVDLNPFSTFSYGKEKKNG